jgi:hypothetical protein
MTIRSSVLAPIPSLWEGVARILDFGGSLNDYNYSLSDVQADRCAIRSDWRNVGIDVAETMYQQLELAII